ncbi:hypothetical protein JKP88DRAFT_263214 [Tribonema minus]|uniref:Uncharacterized protein n=1 Tax=Tribonema minus TaxID=303371 RepID=A0A835Z3F5_9STRA|nr:hypothetical protein JKP88DRAFT_263214 [Tribonema minus]
MEEAVVAAPCAADAIQLCRPLLRHEASALAAGTALMERIRLGLEDKAGVTLIMRAITMQSLPHSAMTAQVLQLLPMVECPQPLIDALPQLVCANTADVDLVVAEYRQLLTADRSLLVPIVGSLHDLPLRRAARAAVAALTLEALAIVDEEDVPVVVRTLLRTCGELQHATLAVMIDVLADAFLLHAGVTKAFLAAVARDVAAGGGDAAPLSDVDVVALLLLLPLPHHAAAVERCLLALAAAPARMPWGALMRAAEAGGRGAQWGRLLATLIDLALWLLTAPVRLAARPRSSSSSGAAASETDAAQLRDGACAVLFVVFETCPPHRERIISACLSVAGDLGRAAAAATAALEIALIKPGPAVPRALLLSAAAPLDVLRALATRMPQLLAPSAAAISDFALHGGAHLQPALLRRAAACLAVLAPHARAAAAAALIHIQKQLLVVGGGADAGRGLRGGAAAAAAAAVRSRRECALLMAWELATVGATDAVDARAIVGWAERVLLACTLPPLQGAAADNAAAPTTDADALRAAALAADLVARCAAHHRRARGGATAALRAHARASGLLQERMLSGDGTSAGVLAVPDGDDGGSGSGGMKRDARLSLLRPERCCVALSAPSRLRSAPPGKDAVRMSPVANAHEFAARCGAAGLGSTADGLSDAAAAARAAWGALLSLEEGAEAAALLRAPVVMPAWPLPADTDAYVAWDFEPPEALAEHRPLSASNAQRTTEAAAACAIAQGIIAANLTQLHKDRLCGEPRADSPAAVDSTNNAQAMLAAHLELGARLRCCLAALLPLLVQNTGSAAASAGKPSRSHSQSALPLNWVAGGAQALQRCCAHTAAQLPLPLLCEGATWRAAALLRAVKAPAQGGRLSRTDACLLDARAELLEVLAVRLRAAASLQLSSAAAAHDAMVAVADMAWVPGGGGAESGAPAAAGGSAAAAVALADVRAWCRLDVLLREAEAVGAAVPVVRLADAEAEHRRASDSDESGSEAQSPQRSHTVRIARLFAAQCHLLLQLLVLARKADGELMPLPPHLVTLAEQFGACGSTTRSTADVSTGSSTGASVVEGSSHRSTTSSDSNGDAGIMALERLFKRLEALLEVCEDSLPAAMLLECLGCLTVGVPKARTAAAAAWRCARRVYPLGHGGAYAGRRASPLVCAEGAVAAARALLRRPLSQRAALARAAAAAGDAPALQQLEALCLADAPGSPSQAFAHRCLVMHWCLVGVEGRLQGLAALVAAVRSHAAGGAAAQQRKGQKRKRSSGDGSGGGGGGGGGGALSKKQLALTLDEFDCIMAAAARLAPAAVLVARPHGSAAGDTPYGPLTDALQLLASLFATCTDVLSSSGGASVPSRAVLPVLRGGAAALKAAAWAAEASAAWRATQPADAAWAAVHHLAPLLQHADAAAAAAHQVCEAARAAAAEGAAAAAAPRALRRAAAALALQHAHCVERLAAVAHQQGLALVSQESVSDSDELLIALAGDLSLAPAAAALVEVCKDSRASPVAAAAVAEQWRTAHVGRQQFASGAAEDDDSQYSEEETESDVKVAPDGSGTESDDCFAIQDIITQAMLRRPAAAAEAPPEPTNDGNAQQLPSPPNPVSRRRSRSCSLGPQPLARKAATSNIILRRSAAAAVVTARNISARVRRLLQHSDHQHSMEERRLQLDSVQFISLLLHRNAARVLGSSIGIGLARAATNLARQLAAARGVFVRRLGAQLDTAPPFRADLEAALHAACARALRAEDPQGDPQLAANAALSVAFITAALASKVGAEEARACAERARSAACAALAAEASSQLRAAARTPSASPPPPLLRGGVCEGDGDASRAAAARVERHRQASAATEQQALRSTAGAQLPPLRLVCRACRRPLASQSSLDVLSNEAVVHEVGVTDGLLQVKVEGWPAAGEEGKQAPILHDERWGPVAAAALAGDTAPLHQLLTAAQRRMDETARSCNCRSSSAVAVADPNAPPVPPPAPTPLLDPVTTVGEFVTAFRRVGEGLLRMCSRARCVALRAQLLGFLQLARGGDDRSMEAAPLSNPHVLAAARAALEWLLASVDELHVAALNDQLRAVTAYLRAAGARHELALAIARLSPSAAAATAALNPLRVTRAFVHRAVATVAEEAHGGGGGGDAQVAANAQALLAALRAAPQPPFAALTALVVRGILGGALAAASTPAGAYPPPCEAPETLLFDGARLQQSAAAVETAAAAAAIAAAVTGSSGGLGPERTVQLLSLLEAPDLTAEHVAAQAVHWAGPSCSSGGGSGGSSSSAEAAARLGGMVLAICERRSPLRGVYLRRCLMAVGDMAAEARCCGGGGDAATARVVAERRGIADLGGYLAARAAAPLLAVTRYNMLVYVDAYSTFAAEALAQLP